MISEVERLSTALDLLAKFDVAITDETVDQAVNDLADQFEECYGSRALSAASKFLWLRHQWPIVILDSQASRSLLAGGGKFDAADYASYRRAWREQFARHETPIRQACSELVGVKRFSLASTAADADVERITSSPWFHDRVFDVLLWRSPFSLAGPSGDVGSASP